MNSKLTRKKYQLYLVSYLLKKHHEGTIFLQRWSS